MLERLINEDKAGAEELFHEIVVEKSRSIYENLLADEEVEEAEDHDDKDDDDEDMEEGSYDKKKKDDEDDEEMSEDFDLDEFEVEGGMNMMAQDEDPTDDPMAMGGDETDDLEMDVSMDDEGEMDGEEDEVEDRVEDLEDALDELKAEFEKMMSGEEGEGEEDDTEMDMDDEEGGEDDAEMDMDDEGEDEEEKEAFDPTDQVATMREYVEKVTAKMGDNGANTQSTVAGPNDMGGTTDNIARADTENGVEANQGNLKGNALSDQNPKDMSTGNVNVPGGKASKSMKNQPKGHGAEKKGSGESGTDAKSPIGSK
jgi:hypothetical protein